VREADCRPATVKPYSISGYRISAMSKDAPQPGCSVLNRPDWPRQCAVVIPCHNESKSVGRLVTEVRQFLPSVQVVDDGSSDGTAVLAREAGAHVIRQGRRSGKGHALRVGLNRARTCGFAWALIMDGDLQHQPADIPSLLDCTDTTGAEMVVGNRMSDAERMPPLRRWVNRWMSRRLSRLTGHFLPDSQCGFRLINLEAWSRLCLRTARFEIESEMLVRFAQAGFRIEFVPVQVCYGAETSKIKPLQDTLRWLHWWFAEVRNARPARLPADTPYFTAPSTMRAP